MDSTRPFPVDVVADPGVIALAGAVVVAVQSTEKDPRSFQDSMGILLLLLLQQLR